MGMYELAAWLGDDHGLDDEQMRDLLWQADEIEARYPDPDDQDLRTAALVTAYRILRGKEGIVEELAEERANAKAAEARALAALKQAAVILVSSVGSESEAGFARRANVDRMAVRSWLGKR